MVKLTENDLVDIPVQLQAFVSNAFSYKLKLNIISDFT